MHQLSSDPEFAFILGEFLSFSNRSGANTGEILRAAAVIKPGDFESWYREFKFLADGIYATAIEAEKKEQLVSARDAFFRSSTYYRAADFFLHGNQDDPRLKSLWEKQNATFRKAAGLLPNPASYVEIATSTFTIPVYFYPADGRLPKSQHPKGKGHTEKKPTVIVGQGYDGAHEALYHMTCRDVIERGWNCVTFEGPGQPTVRRQQGLGFRPDWWEVLRPIVDYLHSRDDVDVDKVALIGVSFGGLLAPRAASHEHRLAAVVACNGMLSLHRSIRSKLTGELEGYYASGNKAAFNTYVNAALASPDTPTIFRWAVEHGMFAWAMTDPYEWFHSVRDFDISEEMLHNISSPVLVVSGENDFMAPGQPEQMDKILGEKGSYVLLKTDLGAGEHVGLGAESQQAMEILGWLGDVFANVTASRMDIRGVAEQDAVPNESSTEEESNGTMFYPVV